MNKNIYLTLVKKEYSHFLNTFVVDDKVGGNDYLFWIKEFEKKGYNVYFVSWDDYDNQSFSYVYSYNESKFIEPKKITSSDAIFLYKQEGFLLPENVSRFKNMLDDLEKTGAFIINNPETIRWNISKEHLYYLMENGARVCRVCEVKDAIPRVSEGEKFVVKPKIASRGNGLILIDSEEDLKQLEQLDNHEEYIAQELCNGIREGEKSLFFVGKEYTHAVLKVPNPNNPSEIRCNKSTGGIVSKYDPSEEEIDYAKNIIEIIAKKYPVMYSRIDFAYHNGKPHLIEAELLNPSAFAIFAEVGSEFAEKFVGFLDKLISEHFQK